MKKVIILALLALAAWAQNPVVRAVTCTDGGSTDAYACTPSPAIGSYTTGLKVNLYPNTVNTGAATLAISGLSVITIKKVAGGITTDLADNDIRAGQYVTLVYDGTNFQMQSMLGNAAAVGSFDPLDLTTVYMRSDFCGQWSTATGLREFGGIDIAWIAYWTGNGEITKQTPELNHPCITRADAGTASANAWIRGGATTYALLKDLDITAGWTAIWIVRYDNVTNLATYVGIGEMTSNTALNSGFFVKFDSAADTYFKYCAMASGSCTYASNSAVTPAINTWYKFKIWSTSNGVVRFAISTNGGAYGDEQPLTGPTGFPTVDLYPMAYWVGSDTVSHKMDFDFFAFYMTGLSR